MDTRAIDTVEILAKVISEHGVTQADFATAAGVTPVTVNRWLNRRTELTEKRLYDALSAVGLTPESYGLKRAGFPVQRGPADERLDELAEQLREANAKLDRLLRAQERRR